MTPDELTRTVADLREFALDIRIQRNSLANKHATLPASVTKSLRDASQALDDAASDLLNAYGSELPEGVM